MKKEEEKNAPHHMVCTTAFSVWGDTCLIKVIKKTLWDFSSKAYNVYCVYLEELGEELEAITVLDWAIIEKWPEKCLQLLNLLNTGAYTRSHVLTP